MKVLHHNIQKNGIPNEKESPHREIQYKLTAYRMGLPIFECPYLMKRKTQSCIQDEPDYGRNDIPDPEIFCKNIQGRVIGNKASGSCNAEPHDLPVARHFDLHCKLPISIFSFWFRNVQLDYL